MFPHLCPGQGSNRKNLTGKRFGRLTALQSVGRSANNTKWECKCDCGKVAIVAQNNLGNGHTKSCGCLQSENHERLKESFSKECIKNEWWKDSWAANQANGWIHITKGWRLRDPNNKVFEFRNLSKFLREHPEMFLPEDLKCRPKKGRKEDGTNCSAYIGIALLRPTMKKIGAASSWKGWTWYSQTERLKNEGRDLLERNGTA